jgi:hypothetical protein
LTRERHPGHVQDERTRGDRGGSSQERGGLRDGVHVEALTGPAASPGNSAFRARRAGAPPTGGCRRGSRFGRSGGRATPCPDRGRGGRVTAQRGFVPRRAGHRCWCAVRAPGCVCRTADQTPGLIDHRGDERRAVGLGEPVWSIPITSCVTWWALSLVWSWESWGHRCCRGGPRSRAAGSVPVPPRSPGWGPDRGEGTAGGTGAARSVPVGPDRRGGWRDQLPCPGGKFAAMSASNSACSNSGSAQTSSANTECRSAGAQTGWSGASQASAG